VVQAATTGYSLVVDHDGHVLQRIPIGKQAVIFHDVEIRTGRTVYSRTGDALVFGVIVLMIVAGVSRRRRTATR
jgi:apolipoprotein N-acyltransferase